MNRFSKLTVILLDLGANIILAPWGVERKTVVEDGEVKVVEHFKKSEGDFGIREAHIKNLNREGEGVEYFDTETEQITIHYRGKVGNK